MSNGADTENQLANEIRQLRFETPNGDDVVAELSKISKLRLFPTGTLIFSEGEPHDRIYFVCDGTVSLEMATPGCGKQRILTMGPGDLLSWSGLLEGGRMTASAVVSEPTRAIEIPVADLHSLCETNYKVGYVIMKRIAHALSRRLLSTRLQLLDFYRIEEA